MLSTGQYLHLPKDKFASIIYIGHYSFSERFKSKNEQVKVPYSGRRCKIGMHVKQAWIVGINVLLVCLAMTLPVQAGPQPLIWREYVGQQQVTSYVPCFVLYDPPGSGSYAKFTTSSSVSTGFSFALWAGGNGVSGGDTEGWSFTSTYQTDANSRKHYVVCNEYKITWDVWYVETPRRSYFTATCVGMAPTAGKALWSFNDLAAHNIMVTDLTGTTGAYHANRAVSAGGAMSDTIEYWSTLTVQIGCGFKFNAFGVPFEATVQVNFASTQKFQVYYYYYDSSVALDFDIESNYNIQNWNNDPKPVNGISIWFSE